MRIAGWLLTLAEPVTREEIWEQFPDEYAGDFAAKERKWTRDKEALQEAGVPIEYLEDAKGYLIRRDEYYLPALQFSPAEVAMLWTAGQAALRLAGLPWRYELESALRKLRSADPVRHERAAVPPVLPGGATTDRDALARHVDLIKDAARRKKRLWMRYFTAGRGEETEREVDVHGIAWRRGSWFLVGHCHLRGTARVFYVSRLRDARINERDPGRPDYEVPADFDIRRYVVQQEWDYWVHAPVAVRVVLRAGLKPIASTLLPGAQLQDDRAGAVEAQLEVRNLDALVRHLLSLGPDAELLAPEEGRARAREMLGKLVRA